MEKLIEEYQKLDEKLRRRLRDYIAAFLKKWGKDGKFSIHLNYVFFNTDIIPVLSVTIDNNYCCLAVEHIKEIYRLDNGKGALYFKTQNGGDVFNFITTQTLMELKRFLDFVGDKANWTDFEIKEGVLHKRTVITCFGEFTIEGDIARSAIDNEFIYHLPRTGMADEEIKEYFEKLKEIEK